MFRATVIAAILLVAAPGSATELLADDFERYTAAGLAPGGPAGTLDSTLWCVIGASDGDAHSGALASDGDFARGESAGGVRSGGLYAFLLPGDRRGLGVQATGADFTPGALIRRAFNVTGQWLSTLALEAELWVLNDGARSTRITVDSAVGDGPWQSVADATLLTARAADTDGWQRFDLVAALPQSLLAPGDGLALRLGFDDAAGSGARDEFALAAWRVSGTAGAGATALVAAPATAWLLLLGVALLTHRLRILNSSASPR